MDTNNKITNTGKAVLASLLGGVQKVGNTGLDIVGSVLNAGSDGISVVAKEVREAASKAGTTVVGTINSVIPVGDPTANMTNAQKAAYFAIQAKAEADLAEIEKKYSAELQKLVQPQAAPVK